MPHSNISAKQAGTEAQTAKRSSKLPFMFSKQGMGLTFVTVGPFTTVLTALCWTTEDRGSICPFHSVDADSIVH
jgi:hypothetical protein